MSGYQTVRRRLEWTSDADEDYEAAEEHHDLPVAAAPVAPPVRRIFVAPYGRRYHYQRECHGLRKAGRIDEVEVVPEGRTLCWYCAQQ